MAFVQVNNQANNSNSNDNWKADAFLNLYLPTAEGRSKLGSIPLRSSKPKEAQLMEWLNADPANVGKLLAKLEIEFNPVTATPASGFLLD